LTPHRVATPADRVCPALAPPPDDAVVKRVRVYEFQWPISPELVIAGRRISERRYAVLEIELGDGLIGTAYCLTRGAPVYDRLSASLNQRLLGTTIAQLLEIAAAGPAAQDDFAASCRAHSLVDICAWDLRAQALGVPVWRCLTASAAARPVLLVDGYREAGETDRQLAARLAARVESGIVAIKLAADSDPTVTDRVLDHLRQAVGDRVELVVDMEQMATDVKTAAASMRLWSAHQLAWVEDPFDPSESRRTRAVRLQGESPIGAGDEGTLKELRDLKDADAVDVLRVDGTTAGGISGALSLIESTGSVSFHVYPEIHRHLAFAFGVSGGIECFPSGGRFDFVERFIRATDITPDDRGWMTPPEEPGLGIALDLEAARSNLIRSHFAER
jgi:L-alanine-DL-glutamate epimerase-like enolase superfamily enzyme